MLITIDDYFDLDKIIDSGQTFRACKIDDNLYRFISMENVLYISKDSSDKFSYNVSCSSYEWQNYWYNYFDLDRNYKSIKPEEEFTKTCYEYSKGIRILKQEPFEMLISFIISQRKSIPAIRTSIEEICKRFGKSYHTSHNEDIYLFPTPKQLEKDNSNELSQCKLGYRLPYILDAVTTISNNPHFLSDGYNMSDEELLEHLMSIKGVGIKVANCIALFAYNRLSLAPIDTWINKIINSRYKGISPFDNYGDNAGIIQQYMFYYAITHKNKI